MNIENLTNTRARRARLVSPFCAIPDLPRWALCAPAWQVWNSAEWTHQTSTAGSAYWLRIGMKIFGKYSKNTIKKRSNICGATGHMKYSNFYACFVLVCALAVITIIVH